MAVYDSLPEEHGLMSEGAFPEEFPFGWCCRAYCPAQQTDPAACAKCYQWKPGNGRSGKGIELNSRAWTAREMFDIIVRHLMGQAHHMIESEAHDMAMKEVLDAFNSHSDWVERVALSEEDRAWWLASFASLRDQAAEDNLTQGKKGSGKGLYKKGMQKGKDGEQGVKRPRNEGGNNLGSGSVNAEVAAAVKSIGQSLSQAVAGALQPGALPGNLMRMQQPQQLQPVPAMGNDIRSAAIEIHSAARRLAKMARMTSELCEREADKMETILTGIGVVLPPA